MNGLFNACSTFVGPVFAVDAAHAAFGRLALAAPIDE